MVKWGSKNKNKTYICLEDIGLRVQIMLTIMGSRWFIHLMSMWILMLIMHKVLIWTLIIIRPSGCQQDLDLLIISHESHVSYPTRSGCKEKSIQLTYIYLIQRLLWLIAHRIIDLPLKLDNGCLSLSTWIIDYATLLLECSWKWDKHCVEVPPI